MTSVAVGLHGLKLTWLDTTLAEGLVRPSAAWFIQPPDRPRPTVCTLAASVFLALSARGRARLSAHALSGSLVDAFLEDRGLMPCLISFQDEPTGLEVLHRYRWSGGGYSGVTAQYTKVERSGRVVDFRQRPAVAKLTSADLPSLEHDLGQRLTDQRSDLYETEPVLVRAAAEGRPKSSPTPLGILCELIALRLGGRLGVRP